MTIQELREKRTKAWHEARNFLDSKRNDSGLLSEEDSAKYDALENTVVDLGDDTFGQTIIGSYKLGTAIKVSEELLNRSYLMILLSIFRHLCLNLNLATKLWHLVTLNITG